MKDHFYLIHGWGFDSRVMNAITPCLEENYKTSFLNMPGYGSDTVSGDSKDIDSIANALMSEITKDCILGGWSLGGMVAIRIAAKIKNKVKALVLINSTPCFVRKPDWSHGMEKNLIENMCQRINDGEKEKVLKEFALVVAKGDASSNNVLRKLYSLLSNNLPDKNTLKDGLSILINADLRKDLEQLMCPVILILAENDQLIARSSGTAIKKLCANPRIEHVQSAGHAPFISRPSEFCNILNNRLKDIH